MNNIRLIHLKSKVWVFWLFDAEHLFCPHREPEKPPSASAILSDSLLPTPVIPKVLHMRMDSQSDI